MTKSHHQDLLTTILTTLGAITTTTLGEIVFQAVGTFFLGVLGAAGGYTFAVIIKPKIDAFIAKRKASKKEQDKTQ